MPNQGTGASFLERFMRSGQKRGNLLGLKDQGGLGMESPTGLGSDALPPPRPTPAGEAAAPPQGNMTMPSPTAAPGAPPPTAPGTPTDFSFPALEEEFPTSTLIGSAGGAVLPAVTTSERFYRRYGRLPGSMETYLLSYRDRFEKAMGRPPTRIEVENNLRREERGDVEI